MNPYRRRYIPPKTIEAQKRSDDQKNLSAAKVILAEYIDIYGAESLPVIWARGIVDAAEDAERQKLAPLLRGIA